jgi:hypothetical protein
MIDLRREHGKGKGFAAGRPLAPHGIKECGAALEAKPDGRLCRRRHQRVRA